MARTPSNYIYTGVWSGKPTAASAPIGAQIQITDVGTSPSVWTSDGTQWRPDHTISLMTYTNDAGLVFAAGGAETAFGTELSLPGDVFYTGCSLVLEAMFSHGTTGETRGVTVRWGATTGALTTSLCAFTSVSTNSNIIILKRYYFSSATTYRAPATVSIGPASINSGTTSTTIAGLASPGFLNFTATPSAANAVTIYGMSLRLID